MNYLNLLIKLAKKFLKNLKMFQLIMWKKNNIYKTNYNKRVLISYIMITKKNKHKYKHSNIQECEIITKIFDHYDYKVDLYDRRYSGKINYSKYDLIFGFGDPFENSFYKKNNLLRIYYATTQNQFFLNNAELKKIKRINVIKNKWIKPVRLEQKNYSLSINLCNSIICIGNDNTSLTYKKYYDGPIYNVPVTGHKLWNQFRRDYTKTCKNFLWFGGDGSALKGLDLCLEVFKINPHLHLDICGRVEQDFIKAYYNELYESENIEYHGFMDITSNEFSEIVMKNTFIILPSSSEGQASSVITCMMASLIPIITKDTGIDIKDFFIEIEELSVDYISNLINESSKMDVIEINNKADLTYKYAIENHILDNFSVKFREAISSILN